MNFICYHIDYLAFNLLISTPVTKITRACLTQLLPTPNYMKTAVLAAILPGKLVPTQFSSVKDGQQFIVLLV